MTVITIAVGSPNEFCERYNICHDRFSSKVKHMLTSLFGVGLDLRIVPNGADLKSGGAK